MAKKNMFEFTIDDEWVMDEINANHGDLVDGLNDDRIDALVASTSNEHYDGSFMDYIMRHHLDDSYYSAIDTIYDLARSYLEDKARPFYDELDDDE